MTTKPITEDDLHAYVDRALDEARDAEISAYLEAHPDIADRIKSYDTQRRDLRAALDPVADEPVPSRLNLAHMIEARSQRMLAPWRMAAAATLLLVAGGSGGWLLHGLYRPFSEGVAALAQEATNSYSVYASDRVRPVELRAEHAAELVDWASQRMGRKPVLPDLSQSGYRFMGGRIISTPHGAGLMLMYDDDRGTRLVMFTRPMAVDQDRSMAAHSEGDIGGWSWASDGMGYSLVGSLPTDVLHPLADEVRRQTSISS